MSASVIDQLHEADGLLSRYPQPVPEQCEEVLIKNLRAKQTGNEYREAYTALPRERRTPSKIEYKHKP